MNTLVFATYDITTAQWTDFWRSGGFSDKDQWANKDPFNPYAFVHSASQQDFSARKHIDGAVKNEFSSANWEHIRTAFKHFYDQDPQKIDPVIFFILDQHSKEDRKVIIMNKSTPAWFTLEGEYAWPENMEETEGLVRRAVWNKYRVPFEKAWTVHSAVGGFCGLEHAEPYFEKELLGDVQTEMEEKSSNNESEESDPEDLEYMTHDQLKELERR
ncbi:hypothetical protein FB567DRAFT_348331 [Paraphoma chrysanthemicola]|uniref:Uncharacterized protein n=1 Tax=Paraphoma chrysanthemicola TaxID=798071 RepID=A0A8K0VY85_9PLEO|nr:hypothetical protein FB567DRAFT_348331 [Paraphoma chrysanthemicola]